MGSRTYENKRKSIERLLRSGWKYHLIFNCWNKNTINYLNNSEKVISFMMDTITKERKITNPYVRVSSIWPLKLWCTLNQGGYTFLVHFYLMNSMFSYSLLFCLSYYHALYQVQLIEGILCLCIWTCNLHENTRKKKI